MNFHSNDTSERRFSAVRTDTFPYLSRIEGSPPKRNAGGSIPPGNAKARARYLALAISILD